VKGIIVVIKYQKTYFLGTAREMYGVMQPMLKFGMLCHYIIKIIFFGYSKTLSVEIVENGW